MLPARHKLMTYQVWKLLEFVRRLLICTCWWLDFSIHLHNFTKNGDITKLDPKLLHLANLQQLTTENRIKS